MTDKPRMIPHPITGDIVSFESLYGPDPQKTGHLSDDTRLNDLEARLDALELMMVEKTTAAVPQPAEDMMAAYIQKAQADFEEGA